MNDKSTLGRRSFMKAAGAAAGASTLAACVPGGGETGSGGSGGSGSGSGPLHLTYWAWVDDPTSTVVQDLAAQFNEERTSLQVDVEIMPAEAVYNRVIASINAGDPPDATAIHVNNVADIAAMGALQELDEYWDSFPEADDITPAAVLGSRLGKEDNPLYTMPWNALVTYLYYRTDWFAEAGIEPPETTDDFLAAARAITDPDAGRYGYGLRGSSHGHIHYFVWLATLGGFDAVRDEQGNPVFDRAENLQYTDWFLDLAREHQVTPPTASGDGFEQIMNNMKAGVSGMMLHHIKSAAELTQSIGAENLAAIPVPASPSGNRFTEFGPNMNAVYADGQDPEAAFEWVSFLASRESQITFSQQDGSLPIIESAWDDEHLQENPFAQVSFEAMADAYLMPFTDRPGYSRLAEQTWPQSTQPALSGGITTEEFATGLADEVRE
ncbi:ABC transporter substrate-binding protein [Ruania alba]|uniref:Carbohydrate ABC transporter substrate-binding protein, CUT1 family n=1 Tax=Ruania alba TaxID=648782 RepID=A0A1H5N1C0_9MICO|nr:sugar ABC transporter substrate-binding protein [Ruania alba]SEE95240.1 carbohydrate ABC transporter substrate-binding protein, CUT1 family [Ruania alba]